MHMWGNPDNYSDKGDFDMVYVGFQTISEHAFHVELFYVISAGKIDKKRIEQFSLSNRYGIKG